MNNYKNCSFKQLIEQLKEQLTNEIKRELNKKLEEVSLEPVFDSLMKNELYKAVIRELSKPSSETNTEIKPFNIIECLYNDYPRFWDKNEGGETPCDRWPKLIGHHKYCEREDKDSILKRIEKEKDEYYE